MPDAHEAARAAIAGYDQAIAEHEAREDAENRPDSPKAGLFNRWQDAYHEALFRAAITGRRYRVRYEPNNRWWQITETGAWLCTCAPGINCRRHPWAGTY